MSKEPLTEERIAEIRGREKAATQGPWRAKCEILEADECGNATAEMTYVSTNDKGICILYGRGHDDANTQEDAAFIAHAREDIPALLDEVERLRAENEKLKEIAWNGIQLMDKTVIREAAREVDMAREKALRRAMEQEKRRLS